jgi:hypothetical protein
MAKIQCQVCQPETSVKNGTVPDQQRYKCQSTDYNLAPRDSGLNSSTALKPNTGLFRCLAKWFDLFPTTTYQWIGLRRKHLESQLWPKALRKSKSTRSSLSSVQNKLKMDPPGAGWLHRENYRLGYRWGNSSTHYPRIWPSNPGQSIVSDKLRLRFWIIFPSTIPPGYQSRTVQLSIHRTTDNRQLCQRSIIDFYPVLCYSPKC